MLAYHGRSGDSQVDSAQRRLQQCPDRMHISYVSVYRVMQSRWIAFLQGHFHATPVATVNVMSVCVADNVIACKFINNIIASDCIAWVGLRIVY